MCKRRAGRTDLLRQRQGTSSDTGRSSVFVSVSLHVGLLFFSQQWQFWELDVWQLPYFVCLNKVVPFFFFLLASWTLKNTCCEAVTCWDLICEQNIGAGVRQKSLHVVIVVGIVVARSCCCRRRHLCFISYPFVIFPSSSLNSICCCPLFCS